MHKEGGFSAGGWLTAAERWGKGLRASPPSARSRPPESKMDPSTLVCPCCRPPAPVLWARHACACGARRCWLPAATCCPGCCVQPISSRPYLASASTSRRWAARGAGARGQQQPMSMGAGRGGVEVSGRGWGRGVALATCMLLALPCHARAPCTLLLSRRISLQVHAAPPPTTTWAQDAWYNIPLQAAYGDDAELSSRYDGWVLDASAQPVLSRRGLLLDLGPLVAGDMLLRWQEMHPFWRNTSAVYNGSVTGLPLDGDSLLLYYRRDLLQGLGLPVPDTWQQLADVAEAVAQRGLVAPNGKPVRALCLPPMLAGAWAPVGVATGRAADRGGGR